MRQLDPRARLVHGLTLARFSGRLCAAPKPGAADRRRLQSDSTLSSGSRVAREGTAEADRGRWRTPLATQCAQQSVAGPLRTQRGHERVASMVVFRGGLLLIDII
jgi:hypothetical protein